MKNLLIVAGTKDSTDFLELIPGEVKVTASTVTELGAACVLPRDNISVVVGSKDEEGFYRLLREIGADGVLDFSHPFAADVSANVKAAAIRAGVPCIRYRREGMKSQDPLIRRFPTYEAAAAALTLVRGNIFLTTGSKTAALFGKLIPDFQQRCYLRVLTSSKVLKELEELGIDPGHIFAMKGVASRELNQALATEINAKVIVAKNSGKNGGTEEKLAAAKELNIPFFLIDPPLEEEGYYTDFQKILEVIHG